ncbi:MAG TPA: GNAT family N-acetyltransferase [Nocardioidaceae bacterium]|nr:GNAT family N-acetyltransferase [Nocardioidaceae bacterium]HSE70434.1 GNAT family N-acetyltransferase [Nocardioidaceae bacterium]
MSTARPELHVTVEAKVDEPTAESFYELYVDTFGDLATKAVARQVLHEHEFREEMVDERVQKYLAWDEDGEVLGMATLTNHLATVPWISPDYFAHHYPEHAARGAVYYLGFILVRQDRRRSRVFSEMITRIVDLLVADRAVCGWDICAFNNDVLRLEDNIEGLLRRLSDVSVRTVDAQTYYSATFHGPADGR